MGSKIVNAPFTEEQVKAIEKWQEFWGLYTCMSYHDCDRMNQPDQGLLRVNTEGFTCPCGDYKQDWCSDTMVGPVRTFGKSQAPKGVKGPPSGWTHKNFR